MKTSGIIRRIDELGRVVLPVEMRRFLHIDVGDSLEIVCEGEGILLKKYSTLGAMKDQCALAATRLKAAFGLPVLFFDATAILASGGFRSPEYSEEMHALLGESGKTVRDLRVGDTLVDGVFMPLRYRGDCYGGVFVAGAGEKEKPLIEACCTFLQEYLC